MVKFIGRNNYYVHPGCYRAILIPLILLVIIFLCVFSCLYHFLINPDTPIQFSTYSQSTIVNSTTITPSDGSIYLNTVVQITPEKTATIQLCKFTAATQMTQFEACQQLYPIGSKIDVVISVMSDQDVRLASDLSSAFGFETLIYFLTLLFPIGVSIALIAGFILRLVYIKIYEGHFNLKSHFLSGKYVVPYLPHLEGSENIDPKKLKYALKYDDKAILMDQSINPQEYAGGILQYKDLLDLSKEEIAETIFYDRVNVESATLRFASLLIGVALIVLGFIFPLGLLIFTSISPFYFSATLHLGALIMGFHAGLFYLGDWIYHTCSTMVAVTSARVIFYKESFLWSAQVEFIYFKDVKSIDLVKKKIPIGGVDQVIRIQSSKDGWQNRIDILYNEHLNAILTKIHKHFLE